MHGRIQASPVANIPQRGRRGFHPFRAADDSSREKRYALTMFPYPSGDLHMGHAEVFALHDVMARYWWLQGYEVLNPMGFDSFGLNAENAAIRDGRVSAPIALPLVIPLTDRREG